MTTSHPGGREGSSKSDDGDETLSVATAHIPSPGEAWQLLLRQSAEAGTMMIVDTHGHPQLEREADASSGGAHRVPLHAPPDGAAGSPSSFCITSIACAVSPGDWQSTLNYAADPSRRETTLPALGVHPWYIYPDLRPSYLSDLESLLLRHPRAVVGEIGLCKVAKFVRQYPADLGGKPAALELQRTVFRDQFLLAAKHRRPVSVHCVQQHGVLIKLLKEVREGALKISREWKKKAQTKAGGEAGDDDSNAQEAPKLTNSFPTAIALHSYTGTAHHIKELLALEASLVTYDSTCERPSDGQDDIMTPIFYFGFSYAVNVEMCSSEKSRTQNINAIRAVPKNRLLAESDVHSPADVETGTAGAIAYLSVATGMSLVEVADTTSSNSLKFLSSVV